MTTIAVAGGTRGIGRAIAEAINSEGKYQVKILSRTETPDIETATGIQVIAVDYDNIEALKKVLNDNLVDTVISTLFVTDSTPQSNLIHAAEASPHTRRFIPSVWGIPYSRTQVGERNMQIGQHKLDAIDALEKTSLEYTSYYVGYFLDYWGYPRVKTYQLPFVIAVDMEHSKAAIPGKGDTLVTFTHTFDVAKYVTASLDLPKWDKESYVIGESVTWNEFVRIAEEAKGEKFEVSHDELDLLLSGKITELPSHPPMYGAMPKDQLQALGSTFGIWSEEGLYHLQPSKTLNQVFPDIKVRTVREVLYAGWHQGN